MQTEAKRQRTAEKKRKKRDVKRELHLKQRHGAQEMAEHDHFIRYHTSPEDLTPEQQAHPGEDSHENHEVGSDTQRQRQLNQSLDIGTTRMKIDGYEDESEQSSGSSSIEDIRKALGLN